VFLAADGRRRRISEPKPIMRPEVFEWSRMIAASSSGHRLVPDTTRGPCPAGHVRPLP